MSVSYSFMHIKKIKSEGHMTSVTDHNLRRKNKDNIINELSSLNKEYVSLSDSYQITENRVNEFLKECKVSLSEKKNECVISSCNSDYMIKVKEKLLMDNIPILEESKKNSATKGERYQISVSAEYSNYLKNIMKDCAIDSLKEKVMNNQTTFYDSFKSRIDNLDYYKNHNIRSNAVLGFEVIMTYSREPNIDPYEWGNLSMKWLKETFNKAPDGKSNIINAVLHMDEPGNPHIHAVIVPIDANGKLNASYYTDGFNALRELQNGYADAIKSLGIKRGIAGSSANHRDINHMYAELNNITEVPKPLKNESTEEYYNRIQNHVEKQLAVGYRQNFDENVRNRQALDTEKESFRSAIKEELEEERLILEHEKKISNKIIADNNKTINEQKEQISNYSEQLEYLQRQYDMTIQIYNNMISDQEDYDEYKKFKKGMGYLKSEEPITYDSMMKNYSYAIECSSKQKNSTDMDVELK